MEEATEIKREFIIELAKLTKQAIEEAKENGVKAEMLNAIRENIKYFSDEWGV